MAYGYYWDDYDYFVDSSGSADWAWQYDYFDDGYLYQEVFGLDNGGYSVVTYDPVDYYDYSSVTYFYDAFWDVSYYYGALDTGGWFVSYDSTSVSDGWRNWYQSYDPSTGITTETTFFDNGTYAVTNWDDAFRYSWDGITTYYDAGGRATYQVGTFDDASYWTTSYDAYNTGTWRETTTYYTAWSDDYYRTTTFDNGQVYNQWL
jgi:hypothetical protein